MLRTGCTGKSGSYNNWKSILNYSGRIESKFSLSVKRSMNKQNENHECIDFHLGELMCNVKRKKGKKKKKKGKYNNIFTK